MWNKKIIKVIPAVVFLFCLLEIFELVLTIGYVGKIEKIEDKILNNLKMLENITILLNEHSECMELEHFKDKGLKIK
ncbi:hypothetical protein [Helicobacter pylori]|uniref:hypothetical protein n=1 Tax=Helicobacter pylori TaxID=210 RepID=UPI0012B347FA|nr:hypothetical protein [Helicobacter pylori]